MLFSNYADFRNRVQVMFDGDDISTSDISVPVLDLLIGSGEQRIYRDVRSSAQEAAFAPTVTNNVAPLPSDFLELKGSPYVSTFGPAEFIPWQQMQNFIQVGADTANAPAFYSFQGDNMIFYPYIATGTSVTGQYYKRFADISTALNAFFNRHPDLFLYAALAESGPFLGETSRLSVWEQKYQSLAISVNEQERRRITRGSKLVVRVG